MSNYQRPVRSGRSQVKNKAPAPVQITTEQILREAQEFKESSHEAPTQTITNLEELDDFRRRQRQYYEGRIRINKERIGYYLRYARWEVSQGEWERARSIFERALDSSPREPALYIAYAELEMEYKFVNHARNIWNRAVELLPRVDQLWYKYAYMEEILGELGLARQVYERWMQLAPDLLAWNQYIKFELRHRNAERARTLYERLLPLHEEPAVFLKYAKFEQEHGSPARVRGVFERAVRDLGEDRAGEEIYLAFTKFEESQKEYERARVIYQYALERLSKSKSLRLFSQYTSFEKQRGDRHTVEEGVLGRRRLEYEEAVRQRPHDYDSWLDFARLEETNGEPAAIREVYERAIANIPPIPEKRYWERYIYLWINFALYEELVAQDPQRTRAVYAKCLQVIPHARFTFPELWIMLANFEIRQKDLTAARKTLGVAIGRCPEDAIFERYVAMEVQLGEFDRARQIYQRFLETNPVSCNAWVQYAALETRLQEWERARALYELAVQQEGLELPERVWRAYIDFETALREHNRVRGLYQRLRQRTKHVKVWVSEAEFEAGLNETKRAREVFQAADQWFRSQEQVDATKESRVLLLNSWHDFERNFGTADTVQVVRAKLPRKVKRRRKLTAESGPEGGLVDAGWEEYHDYIFPEDEAVGSQASTLKLLEAARRWKLMRAGGGGSAGAGEDVQHNKPQVDEQQEGASTAMDTEE